MTRLLSILGSLATTLQKCARGMHHRSHARNLKLGAVAFLNPTGAAHKHMAQLTSAAHKSQPHSIRHTTSIGRKSAPHPTSAAHKSPSHPIRHTTTSGRKSAPHPASVTH